MNNDILHSIFDSMDEGIALINSSNAIIYCNTAFRTMRETAIEKIDNIPVLRLYPPHIRGEVTQILSTLGSTHTAQSSVIMVHTESGRSFSDNFSCARDSVGDFIGIILRSQEVLSVGKTQEGKAIAQKFVSKDVGEIRKDKTIKEITNRRKKEIQALYNLSLVHSTEENRKNILLSGLRHILDMYSIEAGDIRLLDRNKKFFLSPSIYYGESENYVKRIAGMSVDKCICGKAIEEGKTTFISDLTQDRAQSCAHCQEEGFRLSIAIPLIEGEETAGVLHLASHRIKHLDEEEIKMLEVASNFLNLLLNQEKVTEKAHIAREYLKGIISTQSDPVVITDADNIIIDINTALEKVTGIPRTRLLRNSFLTLFPEYMWPAIKELNESVIQEGKIKESGTEIFSSSGEKISVTISTSLLKRPDGKPLGTISVFRARKEEQDLQKEIKRRNREFSSLYTLSYLLTQVTHVGEFLNKAIAETSKMLDLTQRGAFYEIIMGTQKMELRAEITTGQSLPAGEQSIPIGKCICSKVIESGEILVTDSLDEHRHFQHHGEKWNIIVPVKYQDRVKGILLLYSGKNPLLDPGSTQLLITIGNLMGAGLEINRLIKESISRDGVFQDTVQMAVQKTVQKETPFLTTLEKSLQNLHAHESRESLLQAFCTVVLNNYDFSAINITLTQKGTWKNVFMQEGDHALRKSPENALPDSRILWVNENQKSLVTRDLLQPGKRFPDDQELIRKGVKSVISLPLPGRTAPQGVMSIERKTEEPVTEEEVLSLSILAEILAAGLEKLAAPSASATQSIEKVLLELQSAAKIILESTDPMLMEKTIRATAISWFSPHTVSHLTQSEESQQNLGLIFTRGTARQEFLKEVKDRIIHHFPIKENITGLTFNHLTLESLPVAAFTGGLKSFHLFLPLRYFPDTPMFLAIGAESSDYFREKDFEFFALSYLLSLHQMRIRDHSILKKVTASMSEVKKILGQ